MNQMHFIKKAVLLSGVAVMTMAATAHAGFEWRGTLEPPRSAPAPAAEPAQDDMAPVMSPDAMPQPVEDAAAPVTAAPVAAEPAPVMASAAMPSVAPQGDVLTGFGSDIPLVIALQQVVPPGYQYSFSGGVNPGVSVSWEGGLPWQQVLANMLAKNGLGYRISGSALIIHAAQGGGWTPPAQDSAKVEAAAATMSPAPDDMTPVSIAATPQDSAAAAPQADAAPAETFAPKQEPVSIRREKPSSLLERLGWKNGSSGASATPSETAGGATENIAVPPPSASMSPAPAETTMASAAAPAPAPSAAPAAMNGSWSGAKGQTLRDVLKNWSDKAGVELYWSIDYDYRLADDISYNGGYDEAVGGLLDKFAATRPQPYGQLHQSASGPRVLVVKSYDLTR